MKSKALSAKKTVEKQEDVAIIYSSLDTPTMLFYLFSYRTTNLEYGTYLTSQSYKVQRLWHLKTYWSGRWKMLLVCSLDLFPLHGLKE